MTLADKRNLQPGGVHPVRFPVVGKFAFITAKRCHYFFKRESLSISFNNDVCDRHISQFIRSM